MSLSEQEIEQQLRAKGKSAPRITPEHVDAAIVGRQVTLIENTMVTVVVLTLYNGFIVTGVNHGPVDPDNFDAEIGARLAFDAARDKVWELEGYLLADRLHKAAGGAALPHYGTDIDPAEAMAFGTAVELLKSKGYAYDEVRGQWLRGDEDLQPGPAPTHVTVTDSEGNSATLELGQPTIIGADYGSEQTAVDAEGNAIEQIDGSADIVREPVSLDGQATSEPQPPGQPFPGDTTDSTAGLEQASNAIVDPTTQPATFVKVGKNAAGEYGELSSEFPFTDETTDGKRLRNDGAIVNNVLDAAPAREPQG